MTEEYGFYIVGQPIMTPLEELESLIDELDECPQKIKQLREQEEHIFDPKVYIRVDGEFHEVAVVKNAVKTVHVILPSGVKQCLSGECLSEKGKFTRRMKTMDREFFCGWKARQQLLEQIEATKRRSQFLKRNVIPELVREIRQTGETIPGVLVGRLKPHYQNRSVPQQDTLH